MNALFSLAVGLQTLQESFPFPDLRHADSGATAREICADDTGTVMLMDRVSKVLEKSFPRPCLHKHRGKRAGCWNHEWCEGMSEGSDNTECHTLISV